MTKPFWTDPPKDQAEFQRRMSAIRGEAQFTAGGAEEIYRRRKRARQERRYLGVVPEEGNGLDDNHDEGSKVQPQLGRSAMASNIYANRKAARNHRG